MTNWIWYGPKLDYNIFMHFYALLMYKSMKILCKHKYIINGTHTPKFISGSAIGGRPESLNLFLCPPTFSVVW
jgi:hypothetical protein